jgi:hypothetical protein
MSAVWRDMHLISGTDEVSEAQLNNFAATLHSKYGMWERILKWVGAI